MLGKVGDGDGRGSIGPVLVFGSKEVVSELAIIDARRL
jgi:hypothetical protein